MVAALSKLAGPVMVSGANGFLGLHLVHVLLQNGYTVHATVRDASDARKTGPVRQLLERTPTDAGGGALKLFSANLLLEGSFHKAMEGCQVVYHAASPFLISGVTDPLQQVLEPALQGTDNVLKAVNDTDSVQRVVLTSSVAATRVAHQVPKNGTSFTEEDWNESTVDENSHARAVYSYSKAAAERLAWEYVRKQNRWDLVVLNPALVLGPTLSASVTSESFAILKSCLRGGRAIANGALNVVDVRDVVQAHFHAGTLPEAAGRHLLCQDVVEIKTICNTIAELFPGKYPPCDFTENAPFEMFQIDNSRSQEKLGIQYRPLKETIADTVQSYEEVVVGLNNKP